MGNAMDPTQRFSTRVDNYIKYRPHYPREVIDTLVLKCGLTSACLIADIGSGSGALTEAFLRHGNRVFAVEPNREMRKGAERLLGHYSGFCSIEGRAESTSLPEKSVDFLVSGQAFHWFDVARARCEFLRILRPSGWAMIVWNEREYETTPFLIAYDRLLQQYAIDYARAKHKSVYEHSLGDFFGPSGYSEIAFRYQQNMDFEGVKGRMLSSSYTPELGHPNHDPLMAGLLEAFQANAANGIVTMDYITRMYYGRLIDGGQHE